MQDGSYLVAMMGGCSLVLKKDFSIIVAGVNSVVAGAMKLSSGGVPAPLSLKRGSSLPVISRGSS